MLPGCAGARAAAFARKHYFVVSVFVAVPACTEHLIVWPPGLWASALLQVYE